MDSFPSNQCLPRLGHNITGSDPVAIVVEVVTRDSVGGDNDALSLPKVWCCSPFSVASHLELWGSDSRVLIPCQASVSSSTNFWSLLTVNLPTAAGQPTSNPLPSYASWFGQVPQSALPGLTAFSPFASGTFPAPSACYPSTVRWN